MVTSTVLFIHPNTSHYKLIHQLLNINNMKNLLYLPFILFCGFLSAQDYGMFETHYLTPKSGHEQALSEEIAEHNKLFHADGPYANYVTTVMNGPRTGDYVFAMGPCTFTQLDDRPSSAAHGSDWASVQIHAERISNVTFWKRDDNLSYNPSGPAAVAPTMLRVRFFEVADDNLFSKVQAQIVKTIEASGSTRPRTMYQRAFPSSDKRDWAFVSPYENWAELDENGPSFKERFEKANGAENWDQFIEDIGNAIISRDDEWRAIRNDLMGNGN